MTIPNHKPGRDRFMYRHGPVRAPISGAYRLGSTPQTGLKLRGGYEILGLIDRGGSSEVYLARDGDSTLPVIVKMLTKVAAQDMQSRERFILGARSTMAINHPAVARVHSVEVGPTLPPYLIMEALEGESLSRYLDREERMPQTLTVRLAAMAASGLVASHRAGIVHRDIKPGNLYLLGPIGSPYGIKIIDFGLSKDLRNAGSGPESVNLVLGTAQYMAPEQVLADPVDFRTDIYAFGAVLFRMLTGQLPFEFKPGSDLFCHQVFSPAPPPSWLLESMDPRIEQLILGCLRKHPENRYASMYEVLTELIQVETLPWTAQGLVLPRALKAQPDLYVPRSLEGRFVAEELACRSGVQTKWSNGQQENDEMLDTLDDSDFESMYK